MIAPETHLIDLTPEEHRCVASVSCPRVLAMAACIPGSCPAVLDYGEDLIIIGKRLGPDVTLTDGIVGEDEYAVRISKDLVLGALSITSLSFPPSNNTLLIIDGVPQNASLEPQEAPEGSDRQS